jgi:hypothetical protein
VRGLAAGSEIDAWCTKCRLDLGHRIVALVDGRPKRVVCMTCNSEHNYRSPKSSTATPTRGARPSKARSGGVRATARQNTESVRINEWRARVSGQDAQAFTRYSTDLTFVADQLISHRKFGNGYVVEVLGEGKVAVMFQDGRKTLIHARP